MKPRLIDQPTRARTALIVPVGLFGGLMVALAVGSGNGRYLITHLPLPEPGLNGWTLAVLVGAVGFGWWRMHRAVTPPSDECAPEYEPGSFADPAHPYFGTSPAREPGSDVPRRGRHRAPVGYDPDMSAARLLPVDDPAGSVW